MSNYKFETLQLHVGQEKADPVTDAEPYRSMQPLLMYSTIPSMQQTASDCAMQETSMVV